MNDRNMDDVVSSLVRLRSAGWSVAVHNDYKLRGEVYTFWLFTRGVLFVKGEGRTDQEAVKEAETAANLFPADLDITTLQAQAVSARRHTLEEAITCCKAISQWHGSAYDCLSKLEDLLADEVAKNTP